MVRRLPLANHVSSWIRYGIALLFFTLALWLRFYFLPVDGALVFLTFYPVTILTLLVCGIGPGILVALASSLAANYFFLQPFAEITMSSAQGMAQAMFLLWSAVLVRIVHSMHRYAAALEVANQELSNSALRLKALTDSVPMSIVFFDAEDRVQFANRDFRQILGRTDEPNGMHAKEYLGASMYESSRESRQRALAGDHVTNSIEGKVLGVVVQREVSYAPVHDAAGNLLGIFGLGYDVTERERVAAQLDSTQQDLTAVLNNIPGRVTAWNADYTNRFANTAAETAFGFAAGQTLGKDVVSVLGPLRYERSKAFIDAAMTGHMQTQENEECYADGSTHFTRIQYVPQVQDGAVTRLYALAIDQTELKSAMARVRQLAQKLEAAREEERRSVAVMLHEGIAQDLLVMQLSLKQLERQSGNSPLVAGACAEIGASISKCMDDLRYMANDLRPTGLIHVRIAQALADHGRRFGVIANLTIAVSESEKFPWLGEMYQFAFYRAAQEALSNVAKHAHATHVEIHFLSSVDRVTMQITDDGCGVTEENLSKPRTLGLLSIRERFAGLGGSSEITAREGKGSLFTAFLPWPAAGLPLGTYA